MQVVKEKLHPTKLNLTSCLKGLVRLGYRFDSFLAIAIEYLVAENIDIGHVRSFLLGRIATFFAPFAFSKPGNCNRPQFWDMVPSKVRVVPCPELVNGAKRDQYRDHRSRFLATYLQRRICNIVKHKEYPRPKEKKNAYFTIDSERDAIGRASYASNFMPRPIF